MFGITKVHGKQADYLLGKWREDNPILSFVHVKRDETLFISLAYNPQALQLKSYADNDLSRLPVELVFNETMTKNSECSQLNDDKLKQDFLCLQFLQIHANVMCKIEFEHPLC